MFMHFFEGKDRKPMIVTDNANIAEAIRLDNETTEFPMKAPPVYFTGAPNRLTADGLLAGLVAILGDEITIGTNDTRRFRWVTIKNTGDKAKRDGLFSVVLKQRALTEDEAAA